MTPYSVLDDFLQPRRARPFAWGSHDCAMLAADWVVHRTGRDPVSDLRDPALTVLQRIRKVQRAGGYVGLGLERLGPCLPGLQAQRGDVVLVPSGRTRGRWGGSAWGICTGAHIAAPGPQAMVFIPITAAEAAWRV